MIRLLGFLTGSALMTGAIVAAIGLPELADTPDAITITPAVAPSAAPVAAPHEPVPDIVSEIGVDAIAADRATVDPLPITKDASTPPQPGILATAAPAAEQRWHSFWNPVRSEIAANGFATRLRSVTGIDYRVVRLAPGSYQVAFAYGDDNERRTKIAQIEQATGLELPENSP